MKKTFFILMIVLISLTFIYLSLHTDEKKLYTDSDIKSMLDKKELNYVVESKWDEFDLKEIEKIWTNWNFYRKISPIDGMYYHSNSPKPYNTSKSASWKYIIEIDSWIFVFSLNDIFNKYEIHAKSFVLNQLWKWIFVVVNTEKEHKIYSYSSILNVQIWSQWNGVTNFNLYPSLLFSYNPSLNDELRRSDILRIATLNNIFYLDSKDKKFTESLFWSDNKDKWDKLIKMYEHDLSLKFKKYSNFYSDFLNMQDWEIGWNELIDKYSFMLLNNSKKNIYLKNQLSRNILQYFNYIWKNEADNTDSLSLSLQDSILKTLDEMMQSWWKLHSEWIDILKNYYYISYYWSLLGNDDDIIFKDKNSFLKIIKKAIPNIIWSEYFSALSDIYLAYNFSDFKKTSLNDNINLYIANAVSKGMIWNNDFLEFSFFLTQYLNYNMDISKSSVDIFSNLISIVNTNFNLVKDEQKKSSILSIQFYNYSKIIDNINNLVLSTYFTKKEKGNVLKDEFWWENFVNIPKGDILLLKQLYQKWAEDLVSKKEFYKNLWSNDSYTFLKDRYLKLKSIISIFENYNDYIVRINLNKENQDLKWLDFITDTEFKLEDLQEYLSQFNWVDISSLKILNDYKKDLFFNVNLNILGIGFNFKINPNWFIVYDLTFKDSQWKIIDTFKNLPISFEEKEKIYKELFTSQDDIKLKEKYDFKNIFYTVYLANDDKKIQFVAQDDTNINNPVEISLFIQNELILKDFKYTEKFLNIWFNNIKAAIENWEYKINIFDIKKQFTIKDSSLNVEINAWYIFKEHSFSDMQLKLLKDKQVWRKKEYEFNWDTIKIIPEKIFVKNLEEGLKDIGYYLDEIKKNYHPSASNIKIDLNLKKVFIDSNGFNVNLNN